MMFKSQESGDMKAQFSVPDYQFQSNGPQWEQLRQTCKQETLKDNYKYIQRIKKGIQINTWMNFKKRGINASVDPKETLTAE